MRSKDISNKSQSNSNHSLSSKKLKILVVGQIPPPYGGQASSIKRMLDANYSDIHFSHIQLTSSSSMGDLGKIRLQKIIYSIIVLLRIIYTKFRFNIKVLYYPPAPFNLASSLRDILLLLIGRVLFNKVIFHVHAGAFKEKFESNPFLIRKLLSLVYASPDLAIVKSEYSRRDMHIIRPRKLSLVPNGLPDYADSYINYCGKSIIPCVLYVGALYESKGIFDLLEAARILKEQNFIYKIQLVGEGDKSTEQKILAYINRYDIKDYIELLGVKINQEKWKIYANADIFCFPSHLENMPLAIIEAMMFGLPIVATDCGGISELVEDKKNGYLLPIKDPKSIAEKLSVLLVDQELRRKMGQESRRRYLTSFTYEREKDLLHKALLSVLEV